MASAEDVTRMTESEKIELLRRLTETDEPQGWHDEVFEELIDDESSEVRKLAVRGFWYMPQPKYIDMLIAKARDDPAVEVRGNAASVLGAYVYEGSVMEELPQKDFLRIRGFLLGLIRDEDQPLLVRRMALEALSFDTGKDVHEWIEWAYTHSDRKARITALFCMGRNGSGPDGRWDDIIVAELNSPDQGMQLEAIHAATESFLEVATPRLRTLAMSRDKNLRMHAIWALGHTAGPGALEVLELCATDADQDVRETAAEAIEEYDTFTSTDENDLEEDEDWQDGDGAEENERF